MRLLAPLAIIGVAALVIAACTSAENGSASTRCEEAAPVLAANAATWHDYTVSLSGLLMVYARGEDPADVADLEAQFLPELIDILQQFGPPQELQNLQGNTVATGRELSRALDLVADGRDEDASPIFYDIWDEDAENDFLTRVPDWIFDCGA